MAFWVYMLHCADGSYYTGHTDDLDRRLGQHHAGEVAGYTRSRRPLRLAFAQDFPTREEALAMEIRIKGWTRRKKDALACRDWTALKKLARGRNAGQRRQFRE